MKVHVQGDEILDVEARSVVVKDDYDQPVLLVQALGKGQIIITRVTDPNFRKIMESLGIGLRTDYEVHKAHA
jgi:hypothetical protein